MAKGKQGDGRGRRRLRRFAHCLCADPTSRACVRPRTSQSPRFPSGLDLFPSTPFNGIIVPKPIVWGISERERRGDSRLGNYPYAGLVAFFCPLAEAGVTPLFAGMHVLVPRVWVLRTQDCGNGRWIPSRVALPYFAFAQTLGADKISRHCCCLWSLFISHVRSSPRSYTRRARTAVSSEAKGPPVLSVDGRVILDSLEVPRDA